MEQRLNVKSGATSRYRNIIANQVHPFMAAVYPSENGFLQQDNVPRHKARKVQEWFHEHGSEFSLLQWPSHSPDLNPIEHLWDGMERAIWSRDPPPAHLKQLWEALESTWANIPVERFGYLVEESVPR